MNKILRLHNVRLLARKILLKYPFIYNFFLLKINIKKLQKKINYVNEISYESLKKKYYNDLNNYISKIKNIKESNNIFFILDMPWAWDAAFIFIYFKYIFGYLIYEKKCKIYIITNNAYKDITKLYNRFFDIEYLFFDNFITKNIYNYIKQKDWIIFTDKSYWFPDSLNLFFKKPHKWSVYDHLLIVKKILIKELTNFHCDKNQFLIKYDTNLDMQKIEKIKNFSMWKKIILCNFESKSWNMVNGDKINFLDIKKYLLKYWKQLILINSVYDSNEYGIWNNIMVDKLSFSEIIYLMDNNYVNKLISFRNWLNDLLYVFYPDIQQVIYYPNEYIWNVWKLDYKKYTWIKNDLKIDRMNRWKLPDNKLYKQYIKNNFFNTIIDNI